MAQGYDVHRQTRAPVVSPRGRMQAGLLILFPSRHLLGIRAHGFTCCGEVGRTRFVDRLCVELAPVGFPVSRNPSESFEIALNVGNPVEVCPERTHSADQCPHPISQGLGSRHIEFLNARVVGQVRARPVAEFVDCPLKLSGAQTDGAHLMRQVEWNDTMRCFARRPDIERIEKRRQDHNRVKCEPAFAAAQLFEFRDVTRCHPRLTGEIPTKAVHPAPRTRLGVRTAPPHEGVVHEPGGPMRIVVDPRGARQSRHHSIECPPIVGAPVEWVPHSSDRPLPLARVHMLMKPERGTPPRSRRAPEPCRSRRRRAHLRGRHQIRSL
ncbi:hypothetical protein SAMN05444374_11099 [Rhodococcoides kroppenstedtii]|uniref:Uncharacterized protein n=1 Tax=Rhodococcoides kroppenstedtii TaxID=293050 RepID=A0A1I0TX59_9NOCA|nr:hypothetical protein SAMN05444374_11099 [Rhodococcus kroppenstedtii]